MTDAERELLLKVAAVVRGIEMGMETLAGQDAKLSAHLDELMERVLREEA